MRRRGAFSSIPDAAEAAEDSLLDGASAVKAVVTGFFAVAGLRPGVLLAPTALLVGGLGSGVYAFDGRARQPGLDARRPRGFQTDEVPSTAYAAAPGSLAALGVALAYFGAGSMLSCARPGIALAKKSGEGRRATALEEIAGLGAPGLRLPHVRRAILGTLGVVEGGNLGAADLEMNFDPRLPGQELSPGVFGLPWSSAPSDEASAVGEPGGCAGHLLLAADANGLFAGLLFGDCSDGPLVSELGLRFPPLATPVRRGVPRVAPGTPISIDGKLELEIVDGRPMCLRGATRAEGYVGELGRDSATGLLRIGSS